LVHRKDKSRKVNLSPLTNQRSSENAITRYYYQGKSISPKKSYVHRQKEHVIFVHKRLADFNKEKPQIMKCAGIEIRQKKDAEDFYIKT